MSNKTELLRKLKKLANEGIGGEKVSAEKKLNELMNKYGISETELLEDKIETMEFSFHVFGSEDWDTIVDTDPIILDFS